jgi:hypothetical protein
VTDERRTQHQFCEVCGADVRHEANFCSSCGAPQRPGLEVRRDPTVPPPGQGHVETERMNVPPPPPGAATSAGDAGRSFLQSFGLGAGALIGCVTAMIILAAGCAIIVGGLSSVSHH